MSWTKRITDEQLAEIRERAEKATEGNWGVLQIPDRLYVLDRDSDVISEVGNYSDAIFIVTARNEIPRLLTEIKRLRKALETIAWFDEYYSGGIAEEALSDDE